MDTFNSRLRAAMSSAGLETPEAVARACGIPLDHIERLLEMKKAPPLMQSLATIGRFLKVRMVWIVTGLTIPGITGVLDKDDIDALTILAALSPADRKKWLRTGRHMIGD